jgi:signal transduction histidine kinase
VTLRPGQVTLVAAGVGLGVVAEIAAYLPEDPVAAAGDFAVGMAFVLGATLVWQRFRVTAALMAATGLAWYAGSFAGELVFLHRGPLVHLLLSYPHGRLESRAGRAVVALAYLEAVVYPLGDSDAATLVLLAAVLGAAVLGYARAGGLERRGRLTALAAASLIAGALGGAAVARIAGADVDAALLWAYEGALVVVASGLCADLRWGRWARAAVTGLVVDLGDIERELTLGARLARSVGDPSLELGYWDAARERYLDESGEPVELPAADSGRAVILVDSGSGERAAAIVHDRAALGDRSLAEAAAAAVRIAVGNRELQAQVQTKVQDVRASRRRLVEAADLERRRLEAELHDTADPRLATLAELLEGARSGLAEARRELEAARRELDALGRGLHPRALAESGLAAALLELADGFPFAVEVDAETEHLPAPVAAAAYFLCSEGLANSAKHARPSRVRLTALRDDGRLVVEVADDGDGGADLAAGSGLRGLADRVDALGGEFSVGSVSSGGTRLRATLPVAEPAVPRGPLTAEPAT